MFLILLIISYIPKCTVIETNKSASCVQWTKSLTWAILCMCVWRTGPKSCHVICFSTDLYIVCGLLLLYTINIVWYSDLLPEASLFLITWKWVTDFIVKYFAIIIGGIFIERGKKVTKLCFIHVFFHCCIDPMNQTYCHLQERDYI